MKNTILKNYKQAAETIVNDYEAAIKSGKKSDLSELAYIEYRAGTDRNLSNRDRAELKNYVSALSLNSVLIMHT